ncbi:MAG TPA: alpha/beta fold hydrolase [Solirubrobacterales bacterium]|jgi:pimeloyl-ACP methyl ester carboxylesterase|nr:alpha/beta fold hydrolase [Solirubrobacterales bacterium]
MPLTERARVWRQRGQSEEFRGYAIHAFRQPGSGPLLLLLHGFPSSSYDWRLLIKQEAERNLLAFDFLGFGLSEKPPEHDYSLFWQADLTEEMVRRHGGHRPVFVMAHDMGTSVATELMARDLEGRLAMRLHGILLFNGSMVLERASPTPAQQLLRSRIGPLVAKLSNERIFRHQLGSVFSAAHPLTDREGADQWSLVSYNGGRTLGHRLVSYMDQREEHAERWHGAIRDWPGELSLAWGLQDPVATTDVLAALRELRPSVPVTELPALAHYPQLEDPRQMAHVLRGVI